MAVKKVSVVSIIGRMQELDNVIRACEQSKIFHPDNALSFFADTKGFTLINEPNPYGSSLSRLTDAIALSGETLPEKTSFKENLNQDELNIYVDWFSGAMTSMQREKQDVALKIEEYSQSIEQLEHFTGLDFDTDDILKCKYIKVRFGRIPRESYNKLQAYNDNPYVLFFPCTNNAEFYWGMYFAPIENSMEVDRIFAGLYFERIYVPQSSQTPIEAIEDLKVLLAKEKEKLVEIDKKAKKLWKEENEKLKFAQDELEKFSMIIETKRYAAKYGDNFVFTGWVLTNEKADLLDELDKIDSVEYTVEDGDKHTDHSPPVKLKNRWFAKPYEMFVDMYGTPAYGEFDPTMLVAITYTVLFGIMFGDLGQGLVLLLLGLFLAKKKNSGLGRIMIPCGISASFFGLVFGSVFGFEHMLDPMYKSLFGLHEKPVEVMHSETTMAIIFAAVGIGISLLLVAMAINIYSSIHQKNYGKAIFGTNGLVGFIFYASLIGGVGGQMLLGLQILTPLFIIGLLVIPLICLFFSEPLVELVNGEKHWFPKNIGEYCMQSFFEVFEILLSYASNTMSFLRVGAFVLVHTGMMTVVFTLAEMVPGIGYWAIVILGNVIVMAMEALLVGIQVLRLEFYELFSRFFEGTGRTFSPIKLKKDKNI